MSKFGSLLLFVGLNVMFTIELSAQGGDGRSASVTNRKTSSPNTYPRRVIRPVHRVTPNRNLPQVIESGRLSIVVNEGGGRVFLSKIDGDQESELTTAASSAPSLIVRTLPVGSYKVVVKKAGYFDETRIVDIFADKRRKVVLNLRPQMALLTVNTNLKDSEIDIGSVGKFTGSVKKQFVKPGTYKIAVQRRGFVSQTTTVDLKSAGREQNISILLQPLRIDSILALAAEKLTAGNYSAAAELTNDVLLQNASHAKANLLYGQISFQRGDLSSSSYFLKAIGHGETVTLPVKILEDTLGSKLVEVEIRFNRDSLSLRSTARVDLNFTITRSDISEFRRSLDPAFMNYIVVKGKSDFHGRSIAPNLTIYSRLAALRGDSKQVYCAGTTSGRSCTTDNDILFKVITDWLEMKDS